MAKKQKKARRNISRAIVDVKASFNNTLITTTDVNGETLSWASAGTIGFKGSRKSTPYAAQQAADRCARDVMEMGMKKVEAWIKGPGAGREAAIRSLRASGLEITSVKDCTPIPHNGCRPKKRRRV